MMKCQTVMDMLERLAPKKMAEDWDNPGLLAGSPQQEVHKVMTCLDVSIPVVEAAIKGSVDMIVAHHPMIFKGVRHLRTDLYDGKMFQMLLSHNIAVYAAHTNLDIAEGGVNDVLAQAVGLEKIESFVITDAEKGFSLGRIGYLPQVKSLDEFVMDVKKACILAMCELYEVQISQCGKWLFAAVQVLSLYPRQPSRGQMFILLEM